MQQTSSTAQKIWRAHKQALILGGLALAAMAGAAALAGLKPRISCFFTAIYYPHLHARGRMW